jgi:GNAT superfamily N-acetyltransferase
MIDGPGSFGAQMSSRWEDGSTIRLRGGPTLRLHRVRPGDEAALLELAQRSTPQDVRARFHGAVPLHPGPFWSRLTDVDPGRHFALAAYDPDGERGDREILGVVRLVLHEDDRTGELAVAVRSDFQGRGLGSALMAEALRRADELGLSSVEGAVLSDNRAMRRLVQTLGGRSLPSEGYYRTVRVGFELPFSRPRTLESSDPRRDAEVRSRQPQRKSRGTGRPARWAANVSRAERRAVSA